MPQQGRPSAGDFTGRQKAQHAKEQQKANEERSAQMSMATAVETEEERVGVFDAQTGERLDPQNDVAVVVEEARPSFLPEREPVLTGQEDPEEVAPVIAARKAFTQPPPTVVRSSMVTIRVDADIEDMTYGMLNGEPNNYTFKEGLQYRVPVGVAEHLNERGLIRQWIGG